MAFEIVFVRVGRCSHRGVMSSFLLPTLSVTQGRGARRQCFNTSNGRREDLWLGVEDEEIRQGVRTYREGATHMTGHQPIVPKACDSQDEAA